MREVLVLRGYTGEVFFSHTVQEGTKPDFVIRVCDVDKRLCKDLREVAGGVAIGYDRAHHDVYFGGRDALYKCDKINETANAIYKLVTVRQIVQQYKSDRVYFATGDGIYYVHDLATHQAKIKKAANINQVFGMTFRNTTQSKYEPIQILYSDKNAIYKLTPSKNSDVCFKDRKTALRYIPRQKTKEIKRDKNVTRNSTELAKSKRIQKPRAHRMMFAIG
ncbi:unnamed protein product [Arctia plantaginis]|uniref:Uncharacterized protein n=1 Tax=Arctia plantaginis TaxID=874455 RepID=A0A8S1BJ77_ARCPL|nr:unnamed protein product [Arctia plantaginis]